MEGVRGTESIFKFSDAISELVNLLVEILGGCENKAVSWRG